jgi:uncharacterized caspase-like protein
MNLRQLTSILSVVGAVAYAPISSGEGYMIIPDSDEQGRLPAVPRMALVIGAQNYESMDGVPNAINDASEIARALSTSGFTLVRQLTDPRGDEILEAVDELANAAADAGEPGIIALYFSGHGFQEDVFNYIVPVDAHESTKTHDSVVVAEVIRRLSYRRAGLSIFFLDACRGSEPKGESGENARPTKPPRSGFTAIPSARLSIVGLAAAFDRPALSFAKDGDPHSPYAQAILNQMRRESISLAEVFGEVKNEVEFRTRDLPTPQSPERVESGIGTHFYFLARSSERDAESVAFNKAMGSQIKGCIFHFFQFYPDSKLTKTALKYMDEHESDNTLVEALCPPD